MGGLNVIVFAIIAVLAHREKKQKKREGQLGPSSTKSDPNVPTIGEDGIEKKFPLVDEEDVTPVLKY